MTTYFIRACENGDVERVRELLEDPETDVHAENEYAFRRACQLGQTEVVRILLGLDASRRINVHADGEYAFRMACMNGQPEIVRLLLGLTGDRRINVHADGECAFKMACFEGHFEIVQLLLSLTGDRRIDDKDEEENCGFCNACYHEYTEIADLILSSGLDRLPKKVYFNILYEGNLTWEEVLWINKPLSARLTSWRHAYEAHRDARLVYAQAKIGRPMELRRRLYLGKFAGGLDRRGEDGYTPREIAERRGNTKCVAVIDEVAGEFRR